MPEAVTRICDWIQHIAAYARAPQKYHYTVSRAWVEIVAHHAGAGPAGEDFGAFVARHPVLLDKRLLSRHYRSSTLAAPAARHDWVEPDLLPFPWSPAQDSKAG
jgi:hypothetical protein